MHMEWYLWIALVVLLIRTPFCFVNVMRAADNKLAATRRTALDLELIGTVTALVAVLAHGTGSW